MKPARNPFHRRSAHVAGTALILFFELGNPARQAMGADILRGGQPGGLPQGATNPVGTTPPPIVPAGGTTRDSLARTAMALQAVQAMQNSARDLAIKGGNHATTNPSGSGAVLPDVPDGLGTGGLQVDSRVTGANSIFWKGANLPVQSTTSGGTTQVTIKQTAQQALLNWETFNVGKNTTLTFDQSDGKANVGQWIAFNQVNDPLANPTQILGKIEAPGQVYVINRNGIVFGGSSQVNVHALVASTLPINTNLIDRGLLNNPDHQFLFSALPQAAGANGTPAFDPGLPANTRIGDVIVEAGAKLGAPSSAEKIGGRIALVGANVTNNGTISTPDGQTILAAGLQVAFDGHASTDPSLRGLDVYIGAVADPASTLTPYAGTATNSGIIDASRASVTVAGKAVNQLGVITSTTSVSLNGRIDLLAEYDAAGNAAYDAAKPAFLSSFLTRSTGNVTLGEDSVTRILPELDSSETVIGTTLALQSQINVLGKNIHFDDDAILLAPNANVSVRAGSWLTILTSSPPTHTLLRDTGRIDVDAGAIIDVSGSKNVASSVTSNIVKVELRGTELADSPLLRDGPLRGETIYIDVTESGTYNGESWIGTPLADVSGYVNLVQRTVGELTTAGGTVKMEAGSGVTVHDGATIDVSGGWVNYAGGVVQTTRLTAGGKIFDITDATPDRVYDGVFGGSGTVTDTKWGVSQKYTNPITLNGTRYQEGFTQGGSGGKLEITAPSMALDGKLAGSTYRGPRQRENAPQASLLSLSLTATRVTGASVTEYSPLPPVIRFSDTATAANLLDTVYDATGNPLALPAERTGEVILSSDILGSDGFGSLSVFNPDGDVIVEAGTTLSAAPKGSISLDGKNIAIAGTVTAAGGSLSFTTHDFAHSFNPGTEIPAVNTDRGMFTLGPDAVLSTAGYIVDDRPQSSTALQTPLVTTGGTISIKSLSANLAGGSVIDVSGGVRASESGKISYGNAGKLSILTGADSTIPYATGGTLSLGSTLKGYSGAKGGSLALQALAVQIGGASTDAQTLLLAPEFFNQGGFASFGISGIGLEGSGPTTPGAGVKISSGTTIAPVVSSWLANTAGGSLSLDTIVKPEGLRTPVSLSFTATGLRNSADASRFIRRGDLVVEAGAVVNAGPAGSISLKGDTVSLQGSLLASGGSIQVSGGNHLAAAGEGQTAASTVWLGHDAVIDASGSTLLVPDSFGRRRGAVLDGGSISVSGNIIAEAGAVLDVSGTSGTLDLLAGESGKSPTDLSTGSSGTTTTPYSRKVRATTVESDAGTIKLSGGEMLLTDATLRGNAGGDSASGGTLQISSGRFYQSGAVTNASFDTTLVVTGSGTVIPGTLPGGIALEIPADGSGVTGGGRFSTDDFSSGGFANLDLLGNVKFSGDVSIQADGRITAGTGVSFQADGAVNLSASHIAFGKAFQTPLTPEQQAAFKFTNSLGETVTLPPLHGSATLNAKADLIDVGYLSLQGIGEANLVADGGDIRGNGTLEIAGHLGLKAGQIYPPTALSFTIAAFDYSEGGTVHQGSVSIEGSGSRRLPLSAGGSLSIFASSIHQNGVLRAPFGEIRLGWDGSGTAPADLLSGTNFAKTAELMLGSQSVTSVSAIDPVTGKGITIPYGISVNGTSWLDPRGIDISSGGLPQKSVKLSAESVVTEKGSSIDIRGGGDLLAYRWVEGTGGSKDILASAGSFAVVPGYDASYAPYAPFSTDLANVAGGSGYTSSGLGIGDSIRLDGGGGLPAGVYTLLPARYALLPGAFLVTPLDGAAVGQVGKPDGASVVSGFCFNGLEANREIPELATRFEVAPANTVAARAEYTKLLANTFFTSTGGYRLPGDSGQLVFGASASMTLDGNVLSAAPKDFRGGLIDISSPLDILITNGATAPVPGSLVLDAGLLSAFGAESLLIGGVRSASTEGTVVTVTTGNLTVDNAGSALSAPELILVAKEDLTLAAGSELRQTGSAGEAPDTLIIGQSSVAGSGNGALLRLNAGGEGPVLRRGVTPGGAVRLAVGPGSILSGESITLDSTSATLLDSTAVIDAEAISISSGHISLSLDPAVTPGADAGLVLSGSTLAALSSSGTLALASYSSIDLLGAGTVGGLTGAGKPVIDTLALRAAEIRGIGTGSGEVVFNAGTILIDNQPGGTASSAALPNTGSLSFNADHIQLGQGALAIKGFSQTRLNATKDLQALASGSFGASGDLRINAPLTFAANAVKHQISALGALSLTGSTSSGTVSTAGLGASLSFTGSTVDVASRIVMPSGQVILHATSGDVTVGSSIETGGIAKRFKDQTRYTDGGNIQLSADNGNVVLASGGSLDVSARPGGGDAGEIDVSASKGTINLLGRLSGAGGKDGTGGSFSLDAGSLSSTKTLDAILNAASFDQSRDFRIRSGDVVIDSLLARAHSYTLSADAGSVTVSGSIDASGTTGGAVRLVAAKDLTLASGSSIDASAATFDSAGKGGSVTLETRGVSSGMLQMAAGSTIDLGVDATATTGQFTGTLQLRAPRIGGNSDLAIGSVASTITGASHVIAEGYSTYDLTASGGAITTAIQNSVKTDATAFIDHAGTIEDRILASQGGAAGSLGSLLTVRPGAEIINTTGDLTLGTATSNAANGDWNLASFRFGAEQVPGILTLRAAGNLVFNNTLSDGFTNSTYTSDLLARNDALPDHVQAWSFRLIAGADFSAADTRRVHQVQLADDAPIGSAAGSIKLGKNGFSATVTGGNNALTSALLSPTSSTGLFQVIRTGGGDIDMVAGGDVQLLNQFASIYTAGTRVADPKLGGNFDTPTPAVASNNESGVLGAVQQPTPAPVQYTSGGGNVSISAGNDIIHLTKNTAGQLIADSERQMPNNWLYRRASVDTATGEFGLSRFSDVASTTWWVDFTNFFEGVGALGGGNVLLDAGRDVSNVDAVAPTNARMPKGKPDATKLVELGGGDVTVNAARNIDGGVYYVERGHGSLTAGGSIKTNSTRSPSLTILRNPSTVLDSSTWLPTTLFLGKGEFDVAAGGDLLLGPVANPFLLPQGYNNSFWYKTWFSTYSADSGVNVSSLGGDVTLRESIAYDGSRLDVAGYSALQVWMQWEQLLGSSSASFVQPWLRLTESSLAPFATNFSLMPGNLDVVSFSNDINMTGSISLSPAARGGLSMMAAGSIQGFQVAGSTTVSGSTYRVWDDTKINISDADPSAVAGVQTPISYQNIVGFSASRARVTQNGIFAGLDRLFTETGSTDGVLQQKQGLHSAGLLHSGDTEPVRLYAEDGDIGGLTLFSPKATRILAGQDIRDVSFYLQNLSASDVSVISAGRDIILYDTTTGQRVEAAATGNLRTTNGGAEAGDIQIAGPGTLEIFAGRNLDLGVGVNNSDGTGTGITSIGSGRNPYLPFEGADIIAAAGVGDAWSLDSSKADFPAFITKFIRSGEGEAHLKELDLDLAEFDALDVEQQKMVALQIFYFVLRDAGRDRNNPEAEGFGTYDAGKEAVATLFPGTTWDGDINTRSRDIRTKNGGDISLVVPGGSIALATSLTGGTLAPPGIITESGGSINIFADSNVDLGISRIFTLRGGDEIIWSSKGDIAAGSSSKTVQSAPPTRVLIDPQSADVKTDLAGLATGGGIGVLTTVAGVEPSDVDLIAPEGTIDAGDAGIRVSGNLNIAAAVVVNAGNISAGGSSTGAAPAAVSAPSVSSVTAASNAANAAGNADPAQGDHSAAAGQEQVIETPSLITAEVLGYGGGDDEDDEDKKEETP